MEPLTIGIIGIIIMFVLMFLELPIAFCMAITGFIGIALITGTKSALFIIGSYSVNYATSTNFLPLALFILMGQFIFYTGIAEDLFNVAYKWLGKTSGGIVQAVTLSCTGFAACTGDSFAAAATMSKVAYPLMKKLNYDDSIATGAIAVGGTLGILIPPSLPLIVYGILSQTSVADLFTAGIIPGLTLSMLLLLTVYILCKRNPSLAPKNPAEISWKERIFSLPKIWGMVILFVAVLGGLYAGVFAPSEAGAIGAFGAFIIGISKRTLKVPQCLEALKGGVQTTCMVLTMVIGAMIFNVFLTTSGLSYMLTDFIAGLEISRYWIMAVILAVYLVLGCLMDTAAMCLLTIPTFVPIVTGLGFSPIHFGILFTIMAEVALITPPVGLNVFIVQGMTRVPMTKIFKGVFPFVGTMMAFVIVILFFPQIALWLPSLR